jgi:hypothetical protein
MTFQRLMDHIFFYLPFSFVYLDDLTICWWPTAALKITATTYGRLSIGSRRMGWSSIGKSVCSGCLK